MIRPFRLTGNTEQKFSKIETVLNRFKRKLSNHTYGVIPASMVSHFITSPGDGGLILKCGMFEGEVKKVLFHIGEIKGKGRPKYTVRLSNSIETREVIFDTKKTTHIMEIDKKVKDGDIIELYFTSPEEDGKKTVSIKDIYVTVLIQLKKDLNEVKEFLTDELAIEFDKEDSDEGIRTSD